MDEKNKKGLRLLLVVFAVLLLILIGAVAAYLHWERAPEVTAETAPLVIAVSRPATRDREPDGGDTAGRTRREGVYTLLLAGQDNGNGNTDTMMLARLDTLAHTIDVVSLPRDTMVNAGWEIHKLNAAYAVGALNGGGAESLCRHVAKLIGFEADSYAFVDLDAFVAVIDALGGVDFDVPVAMDYEDLGQDLRIHLQPGFQHLNGYQAMGLCRFRSGYVNADLGRIEMQQRFLEACAGQFLTLGNIPNAGKVVEILSKNLETDLTGGNIAWFLRQYLKCRSEDIRFYTAPSVETGMDGYSYTVLELDPWLEMINACLNPYEEAITEGDLDLVYFRNGRMGCTTSMRFSLAMPPSEAVPALQEVEEPSVTFVMEEGEQRPTIVVVDLNEPSPPPEETEPPDETQPPIGETAPEQPEPTAEPEAPGEAEAPTEPEMPEEPSAPEIEIVLEGAGGET